MRPLQTHGLFDETWNPPFSGSRFFSYTKVDEPWLRPAGFGHITKTPKPLYDLRLSDDSLVGYVAHDPSKCSRRYMSVAVIDPVDCTVVPSWGEAVPRCEFQQVTLEVGEFRVAGEWFCCWRILSPYDAASLVRNGFIVAIGQDNLRRLEAELLRKHYCQNEAFRCR